MQERYTPLSREAGTATHCLLSFSSVTFMSTVEALLLKFLLGSPLLGLPGYATFDTKAKEIEHAGTANVKDITSAYLAT